MITKERYQETERRKETRTKEREQHLPNPSIQLKELQISKNPGPLTAGTD